MPSLCHCRRERLESTCASQADSPDLRPHPRDLMRATLVISPDLGLAWCPVSAATPREWATTLFNLKVNKGQLLP